MPLFTGESLKAASAVLMTGILVGLSGQGFAAEPAARAVPEGDRARELPPLFFKQEWVWMRPAGDTKQIPVVDAIRTTAEQEVKVYGTDGKDLLVSGAPDNPTNPVNLWNGLTTSPVAATIRDKNNFVDLTGLAKIRWVVRTSGFHAVRPVVKLADGTLLVGDFAATSTATFLESEIAFAALRWIKLDPDRIVTKGAYSGGGDAAAWYPNPDLSKVDEVGFADLMPGSGHGAGGYANVSRFEVFGKPVKR